MASGVTASAQITASIGKFVAEAEFVQEHKFVMLPTLDGVRLPLKKSTTYNEPYYGAFAASSLTDGEEFDSPTQITDTNVTYTPAEYGVQVMWTDRMADIITENFPKIAADLMMNAIEFQRDQNLLTLLDGASQSMGSGTATMSWGTLRKAVAIIRSGRTAGSLRTGARTTGDPPPPDAPMFCALHEWQMYDLAAQFSGVSGAPTQLTTGAPEGNYFGNALSGMNETWLKGYFKTTDISGVHVFTDNNLPVSSNATKSGVYCKMGAVHLGFRGIKEYRTRAVDGRATRHTVWIDYGYGERVDNWIYELHVDATIPS